MKEVLDFYKEKIKSSLILKELNLVNNNYFLASIHREENIENEQNFLKIQNILNEIEDKYKIPIIFLLIHEQEKKLKL